MMPWTQPVNNVAPLQKIRQMVMIRFFARVAHDAREWHHERGEKDGADQPSCGDVRPRSLPIWEIDPIDGAIPLMEEKGEAEEDQQLPFVGAARLRSHRANVTTIASQSHFGSAGDAMPAAPD